jgi:hypothetical protein
MLLFLRKSHVSAVVSFLRKIPKSIKEAFDDPEIGPVGVLKSPQPYIFQVNEAQNPNIKSMSVKCISLCFGSAREKSKGSVIPKHTLQDDTWVHMGLYGLDLDLQDSNILPTLPYDVIRSAEFFKSPEFSVKVCYLYIDTLYPISYIFNSFLNSLIIIIVFVCLSLCMYTQISLDKLPESVYSALAAHEQEFVSRGEYFLRLSFPDEQVHRLIHI